MRSPQQSLLSKPLHLSTWSHPIHLLHHPHTPSSLFDATVAVSYPFTIRFWVVPDLVGDLFLDFRDHLIVRCDRVGRMCGGGRCSRVKCTQELSGSRVLEECQGS